MGDCFSSTARLGSADGKIAMQHDSKNRNGTFSESSKGATRRESGSPKRHSERVEDGLKETLLISRGPGHAEEDMSSRYRPHPDQGEGKPGRRGSGRDKAAMGHSDPKTSSANPAKKARKEEEECNRNPRTQAPLKTEAARPMANAAQGGEGDAERGGGRSARRAKEPPPLEAEAHSGEEKMEVSGQPEPPPTPRLEPASPAVPPPVEQKAEPLAEGGGATEEQAEQEEEDDEGEDLYRDEEEIEQDRNKHKKGQLEPLAVHDRVPEGSGSSVEDVVNLLDYSQREWKGNTPKSALIRKGYADLSQSFVGLRRVRGDNYCALRATLFQVLSQSTQLPAWLTEEDVAQWPEQLLAEKELIGQWQFPTGHKVEQAPEGTIERLKHYMGVLRTRWEAAAQAGSARERQAACEEVFRAREEEYGLLEVLKLLMLRQARQLHSRMQSAAADVPVFCWLLFARDTSSCPRDFLLNHLRHVGAGGGLEQVEMFLLGYALQQTIKVYRLYKAGTEEFITYYPDDHPDWPCVCLLTEDDRHYNVPVSESEGLQVPEAPTLV